MVGPLDESSLSGYAKAVRGRLSPGGLPGLQNRVRGGAEPTLVGSTPIRSRQKVGSLSNRQRPVLLPVSGVLDLLSLLLAERL